jgi:hypothetical protein
MSTTPKAAKPTANRNARRADAARASKQDTTEMVAALETVAVSNTTSNVDTDAFIAAVRADLDDIANAETGVVKKTQHIAWMIMQYRDTMPNEKHWTTLHESPTVRNEWFSAMRKTFLGTAPSMAGEKTQDTRNAKAEYDARLRVFNQAMWLCLALGLKGVDASAYSETLNCFKVPPVCIIEKGDEPALDLAEAIKANPDVAIMLDRSMWTVSGRNKDGKPMTMDIRASVAQVITAYNSKPVTVPTIVPNITAGGVAVPAGQSSSTASVAGAQSNPATLVSEPVIKSVLRNAGIEKLAPALLDAFNADPTAKMTRKDFSDKTWNALMSLGMRIEVLRTKADAEAAATKAA